MTLTIHRGPEQIDFESTEEGVWFELKQEDGGTWTMRLSEEEFFMHLKGICFYESGKLPIKP